MPLSTLQAKLLSNPQPVGPVVPTAKLINFAQTPLEPYYSQPEAFALVIDNLFTQEECEDLLALAKSDSEGWEVALLNIGGGREALVPEVRDCTRIMRDDFDTAGWIYERIKPYLEEVTVIGIDSKKWGWIAPRRGSRRGETPINWEMTRLNERLRFLKYTKNQYFQPHQDGQYVTPDRTEASFLTLHLYLNSTGSTSEPGSLRGGSTRFMTPSGEKTSYLDVEAKQGRALIFQHARLIHSGEKVTSGTKYTIRSDVMYRRIIKHQDQELAEDERMSE